MGTATEAESSAGAAPAQELSLAGLVAFVVELGARELDQKLVWTRLVSVLDTANLETGSSGPAWFESQAATDAVSTLVAR
jgi:hypothetical protein